MYPRSGRLEVKREYKRLLMTLAVPLQWGSTQKRLSYQVTAARRGAMEEVSLTCSGKQ